jgi:hypothetical protein
MKKLGIVALLLAMPIAAFADGYIFVNKHDDSYHVVRQVVGTSPRECDPGFAMACDPPAPSRFTYRDVAYGNAATGAKNRHHVGVERGR